MGRSMENAGWCRAIARDFMRLAQAARTPHARLELLDKAFTWARLGEEPPGYGDAASAPGDGGHVELARGMPGDRTRRHA